MENYLRDLMVTLSKQGVDNAALVHHSNISLNNSNETYKSQGQRLAITRAAVWARLLFTPISPGFPRLLNRAITEQKPDLLHFHMPNVSVFWALFVPRARRIPWVTHWHSDVLASEYSLGLRLFYTFYRPFERAILKRSSCIITTSPPYLDTSEVLREFRDKCQVVPLGLDPNNFPTTARQKHAADDKTPLQVLAIGRLTYYKGFEYLIRAIAECSNIEVQLVGSGEEGEYLKALSQKLGLGRRITFHGHLSPQQLAKQFAACDCLCLSSVERTEAFGMVLLEAMHWGKATIVSDVPGSGMGWVVEDGITGLITPPKDPIKLAGALRHLDSDRDRMRLLGQQGRHKFDRLFHINQSAGSIAELYAKVLDENPTSTNRHR